MESTSGNKPGLEEPEEPMSEERKAQLMREYHQTAGGRARDEDLREENTIAEQNLAGADALDAENRRLQEIADKLKPKIEPPQE